MSTMGKVICDRYTVSFIGFMTTLLILVCAAGYFQPSVSENVPSDLGSSYEYCVKYVYNVAGNTHELDPSAVSEFCKTRMEKVKSEEVRKNRIAEKNAESLKNLLDNK